MKLDHKGWSFTTELEETHAYYRINHGYPWL